MTKKILIVGSELLTAEVIQAATRRFGHNVVGIYTSGKEAIERFSKSEVDLTIIDLDLDGKIDGIAVGYFIKDKGAGRFMYLTSTYDEDRFESAIRTGPTQFLVKPFSIPQLQFSVNLSLHSRISIKIDSNLNSKSGWATPPNAIKDETIYLNKNITFLLSATDCNLSELSRRTGVPKQTLSSWASGKIPRSLEKLRVIATEFGVTVDKLYHKNLSQK